MSIESPAEGVVFMKKSVIMFALADAGLNKKQLNRVADYLVAECDEYAQMEHIKGFIEDPNAYYDTMVQEIRTVWFDSGYCSRFKRRATKARRSREFASPLTFMSENHSKAVYALLDGILHYHQEDAVLARHMLARHKSWISEADILTAEAIMENSGIPEEEVNRVLRVLRKISLTLFY